MSHFLAKEKGFSKIISTIILVTLMIGTFLSLSMSKRVHLKQPSKLSKTLDQRIAEAKDNDIITVIIKLESVELQNVKHEAVIENIIQEEVSHVLMLQKFKTGEIPPPPDVDAL